MHELGTQESPSLLFRACFNISQPQRLSAKRKMSKPSRNSEFSPLMIRYKGR
ncbi:hypothetical protein AM1_A0064 (plasmid) [Acaryochloris marina MBIC11017]|uniref:Uncharacterized protein n=1 Tax=Acaryochloris marina (strain MBIC 11017) TaxID=329726 RepID=A8ZK73_ACAM1|nr:hypothetical protein AM1_A0064 [Acaryochloris marina MBIC11017]